MPFPAFSKLLKPLEVIFLAKSKATFDLAIYIFEVEAPGVGVGLGVGSGVGTGVGVGVGLGTTGYAGINDAIGVVTFAALPKTVSAPVRLVYSEIPKGHVPLKL